MDHRGRSSMSMADRSSGHDRRRRCSGHEWGTPPPGGTPIRWRGAALATAHPETPRLIYRLGNQGAPMAKRLLDWPGRTDRFRCGRGHGTVRRGQRQQRQASSDVSHDISITVFDDAQVSSADHRRQRIKRRTPLRHYCRDSPTIADNDSSRSGRKLCRGSTRGCIRSAAEARRPPRVSWPMAGADEAFQRIKEPYFRCGLRC